MKRILLSISICIFFNSVNAQTITTIAGGVSWPGEGGLSTLAQMRPNGVVLSPNGDLYYSDIAYHVVRKISRSGFVTTIAGSDTAGYSGDGGDARLAKLNFPRGLALDSEGNLYICDRLNFRIRKVSTTGVITTVAGNGQIGSSGDGGLAINAQLLPSYIYVDLNRNLIISENAKVRKVDPQGIISTIAGGGNWISEGSSAPLAEYGLLSDIYLSSRGDLYVTDLSSHSVRKISASGVVSTIAGVGTSGFSGDGGPGNKASLSSPSGVAVDNSGNVYIADAGNSRIRKVNPLGIISTFAGNNSNGYNGDSGVATSISLDSPTDVAIDANGNVFIADQINRLIRKVDISGNLTTIAGSRTTLGSTGDGGIARQASFSSLTSLDLDTANNIYITDQAANRVRKISKDGIISTIAGNGNFGNSAEGVLATSTSLNAPRGITVDRLGNVYITDNSNKVRRINSSGIISTFVGNGTRGYSGDGGDARLATIATPSGVAIDSLGNLYIADRSNFRVRRVNTLGIISTYSGTGSFGATGNPQDGIPANQVYQVFPYQITGDNSGNIYFGEDRNRIRKISRDGIISTVAGNGIQGFSGDGGPATSASIFVPRALKIDVSGNLIFSDNNRVRRVQSNGIINTIAGTGIQGFSGDGDVATTALVGFITSLDIDTSGNIFFADQTSNRIRRITSNGIINTYAGTGTISFSGDGGPSTAAQISGPGSITVDASGTIYFVDRGNRRIRKITPNGIISTIAGNGLSGFSGDGGDALSATFNDIADIAVDNQGNLYICDKLNYRIRKLNLSTGVINTIAGNGSTLFSGDGGPAIAAGIGWPTSVAVDVNGNIYLSDEWNIVVRKISNTGVITTVAGNLQYGFSGDGGAATAATLAWPIDIALDAHGNLYILDNDNYRIRKVSLSGIITTVAGGGSYLGDGGSATFASLGYSSSISVDPSGNIFLSEGGSQIRKISPNGIITGYAGNRNPGFSGDDGPAISARINSATMIAVDVAGNLYISDAGNNRIRKVTPCLTSPSAPTITTSNGTTTGCQNTEFSIKSSSSGLHQWYRNGRLFLDSLSNEFRPSLSGDYSVRVTDVNNCTSGFSSTIPITISASPLAPEFSNRTVCKDSSSINLSTIASASTGNTLRWYGIDSIGGVGSSVAPIVSNTIVGTKYYYVAQVNTNGCESPRSKIAITINPVPIAPDVTSLKFCVGALATALKATGATGNTLLWYADAVGGTGNAAAPIPSTQIVGTKDYFVSQVNVEGCISPRAIISVMINAIPEAPVVAALSACQNTTASPLNATVLSGHVLNWYGTSLTGGNASAVAPTPSTATLGNVDYYVSQTNTSSGCESQRSKLTFTVNSIPGKASISRDVNGNLLSNFSNGNQWFKDATLISGATSQTYKPTTNGFYTVSVTLNGCTGALSESYYYLTTSLMNLTIGENNMRIYPNPSTGLIWIDLGQKPIRSAVIRVINVQGRELLKTETREQLLEVMLLGLPSATYYIEVTEENRKRSLRFMKN
jgi:sugar lactone lactonase YvrE